MIKPVAWLFQHEETGVVHIVDCQQVEWGFEKNNPRLQKIGPLYAIPETHRIVRVELLRRAELSLCKEAQCDVTEGWDGPLNFAEQLRAIIDAAKEEGK